MTKCDESNKTIQKVCELLRQGEETLAEGKVIIKEYKDLDHLRFLPWIYLRQGRLLNRLREIVELNREIERSIKGLIGFPKC